MDYNNTSIYYPLSIDSGLGKLAEENTYEEYVRQLIIQVLFTNPGERVNRPDFGCGIKRMVFAPNSELTASLLQVTILQSLQKWLNQLIEVQEVKATPVDEKLEIHLVYILKINRERKYLNLEVNL
ncbi:MAG: GPW/gp25 family protein [Bacteroidetes bacterium]|nr:GPW/gp25 family protein [Bacteroidota bacterium]MBL7103292.1 GPW/gp25 family protein [Bacteroidales bacterium]